MKRTSKAKLLSLVAGMLATPLIAYSQEPDEVVKATALGISVSELQRIQDYLERRTPTASIVSTTSLRGEPVDCLDFYAQPGVRDLLARGEKIDSIPTAPDNARSAERAMKAGPNTTDVSLPKACPNGSVPIHRLTVEAIAEFGSLDGYLHKASPAVNTHEHSLTKLAGPTGEQFPT